MKAFFQHWYVINQLYHYLYKRGDEFEFAEIDDFTRWCVGEDLKNTPSHWYNYLPPKGRIKMFYHKIMIRLFMRNPTTRYFKAGLPKGYIESQEKKTIKWIIDECVKPHHELINKNGDRIRLAPKGREQYSVSYIIFGNDYAKKIWTAIIAGMVLWWITYRIENIKPQVIYINEQPKTEILQTSQ